MMVAHCLRIECYEMAACRFASLLAGQLGLMREPEILLEFLAQEKDMADALNEPEPALFTVAQVD